MAAPGYLFVQGSFWDEARQKAYSAALPPIYRQYAGHYLAIGGGAGVQVVEGLWHPRGLVLARFQSAAAVDRFWWSAEYRAAATLRQGAGAFTVLKLDGTEDAAPGGAYLFTLVRMDAAGFANAAARFDALARVHGGRMIAQAAPNSLQPLEGAFFDTGLVIRRFPSEDALRAYLADSAYSQLAAERRKMGDVVVLVRKGQDAA